MTTQTTLLTLALAAIASAATLGASAATYNPDNDSTAFFAYSAVQAAGIKAAAGMPRQGEVSSDGLYVYSPSDRGWVARSHSYEWAGGRLMHTADCLPYDAPAPIAAIVPPLRTGAFADHGR